MKKTVLGLALVLACAAPGAAQQAARPQAIEHSDAYYTRLTIHRVGSYTMLPLFAGEYLLGRKLEQFGDIPGWVKPTHRAVAIGIGALFAVNTVTGAMNLWEDRGDKTGRNRRWLHAALMTAADAGFAITPMLIHHHDSADDANHRNAALVSIGLATGGTLIMWLSGGAH
jgi:hypothetical protein